LQLRGMPITVDEDEGDYETDEGAGEGDCEDVADSLACVLQRLDLSAQQIQKIRLLDGHRQALQQQNEALLQQKAEALQAINLRRTELQSRLDPSGAVGAATVARTKRRSGAADAAEEFSADERSVSARPSSDSFASSSRSDALLPPPPAGPEGERWRSLGSDADPEDERWRSLSADPMEIHTGGDSMGDCAERALQHVISMLKDDSKWGGDPKRIMEQVRNLERICGELACYPSDSALGSSRQSTPGAGSRGGFGLGPPMARRVVSEGMRSSLGSSFSSQTDLSTSLNSLGRVESANEMVTN